MSYPMFDWIWTAIFVVGLVTCLLGGIGLAGLLAFQVGEWAFRRIRDCGFSMWVFMVLARRKFYRQKTSFGWMKEQLILWTRASAACRHCRPDRNTTKSMWALPDSLNNSPQDN